MTQAVKKIDLLDFTNQRRVTIDSMSPSASDDLHPGPGRKVLVQTQRAKDLKFYIILEDMVCFEDKNVANVV